MGYLDQEAFEEKPSVLGFNGGKAGVVHNCTVKVEKKGANDKENAPMYKLLAWDENQIKNEAGIEEDKIYPVNKGYFHQDCDALKGTKKEKFYVNELKHLLKTFGHELTKNKKGVLTPVPTRDIKDFNDFMDYTLGFVNDRIKEGDNKFDIAVDYGNPGYEKAFLQLNGYPWYIVVCGSKIENSRNAVMERPVADDKEDTSGSTSTEGTSEPPW